MSTMAGVERPEIEIMEGEVPAAAGELAETAVPSPKASGPVGPPASPLTVVAGTKDIVLSMAKLTQQSEQHLSRSTRAAEASLEGIDGLEVHLKAIAGHLQKLVELQSKKPDEPKAAGPKMPPPPMAPTTGNAPAPGVPGGMTAPPGAVQPKLMPGSLNPPTPSAFPPSPAFTTPASFTTPAFGAGIFGTPQTPAPEATSAPAVPSAPGYKRVRLADGQWSWAEIGQGDI